MNLNIESIIDSISHAMQSEFDDQWAVNRNNIQEVLFSEKHNIAELLQLHTDGELDLVELQSEISDILLVIENKLLAKTIANKVMVKKALDLALNALLGSVSKVF